jgi:hypothetical protein
VSVAPDDATQCESGHHRQSRRWEAGFADGLGLPVIYTCRRREWEQAKTHFDTKHMRTIIWDVADFKPSENELTAVIRATLRSEAKQSDQ